MILLHNNIYGMPPVKRWRQVEMIHGVASRYRRRAWPRRPRLRWDKRAYETADDEAATHQIAIFGISYPGCFLQLEAFCWTEHFCPWVLAGSLDGYASLALPAALLLSVFVGWGCLPNWEGSHSFRAFFSGCTTDLISSGSKIKIKSAHRALVFFCL